MLYLSHKATLNIQCVKMWEKVVKGDTPTLFLIDYQHIVTNSHPKNPVPTRYIMKERPRRALSHYNQPLSH